MRFLFAILALLAGADAMAGEKLAKKCTACHVFDQGGATDFWFMSNSFDQPSYGRIAGNRASDISVLDPTSGVLDPTLAPKKGATPPNEKTSKTRSPKILKNQRVAARARVVWGPRKTANS